MSRHPDRKISETPGVDCNREITISLSLMSASIANPTAFVITFFIKDTQRPLIFKRFLGQKSGKHKSWKRENNNNYVLSVKAVLNHI